MLRNLPLAISVLMSGNASSGISANYLADAYYDAVLSALYQDSAKTTPVAADADPVGAWVDTVSGYDGTQGTTANKPAYRTDDSRVEFDGSEDYLIADAAAALFTGDDKAWTVIIAANVTSVAATMQFLSLDNNAGSALMEFRSNAYYVGKRDDANNFFSAQVGAAPTGKRLTVFTCSGTVVTIRDNGVTVLDEQALNAGVTTLNVLHIGRRADAATAYYTGSIYRMGLYGSRLSDEDIALIEDKWNSDLGLY